MSETEKKDMLKELVDLVSAELQKMVTITEEQYKQSKSRENPDLAHRYYLQGCIRGYHDAQAMLYKAELELRKR